MNSPAAFWGIRAGSIILGLAFCFGIHLLQGVMDAFSYRILVLCGLYVTLTVSLNLINGITGQFSLGHAAFYQVGAYGAGFLTVSFYNQSNVDTIPWLLLMLVAGGLMAALAGLLVGLPSLRLKGDYLAIVTLGFGEIIRIAVINTKEVGQAYGMNVTPGIKAPWLVWLLALCCIAVCRNLLKNAHGLPFLGVREDEVASGAMGVNNTNVKVAAFIIGAAFAGAAGCLLAHQEGFVTPDLFKMETSIMVLTMVVLGGSGSITGSVIAAIFLTILPEWLRNLKDGSGQPYQVHLGAIIGVILALGAFVVLCRWVKDKSHSEGLKKAGYYSGVVFGCIALAVITGLILGNVPILGGTSFGVGELRMSIFAIILIVVMLIRPEGVLGHHEFSWSLFKKKPQEAAA